MDVDPPAPTAVSGDKFGAFLSETLQHIQGGKPSIIMVSPTDTVSHVHKLLGDHTILSVPVFDPVTKQYTAFVDTLDLVRLVHQTNGSDVALHSTTVQQLIESRPLSHNSFKDNLHVLKTAQSVLDLFKPLSIGVHRVLIHDDTVPDASHFRVFSQTDAIALISARRVQLPPSLLNRKVCELCGHDPVGTIPKTSPAAHAFEVMSSKRRSALAVVDPDNKGVMITSISSSDLRSVEIGTLMKTMQLPILEFLEAHRGCFTAPITIPLTGSLQDAIEKLVSTKVHRLFVVNPQGRPMSVLSLTDVVAAVVAAATKH